MTDAEWVELKKYYKFGLAERRPLLKYELEEQSERIRSDRGASDFHNLVAEVDRLRAALLRYGGHDPSCDWQKEGCGCGYRDVLGRE
ncbi:MAG TPA: hypothetical protein VEX13_14925 [Chloroflexia bacterium]|nr:hypothetical protein [Chloroflexia bacterium]